MGHFSKNNKRKGMSNSRDDKKQKTSDDKVHDDYRKNYTEQHEGSFPIEQLKELEMYKQKIDLAPDAPKRKYGLCIGYLGTNYQGLQINPGATTVEQLLERALLLSGGIIEPNYGNLQKIQWTRAARTDKGVHAVANCCAMKLKCPVGFENEFIENVNKFLDPDIRLLAMTKTTKRFNAKDFCSQRKYEYLLPTYCLQPAQPVNRVFSEQQSIQGDVTDAARVGGYAEPGSRKYLTRESLNQIRTNSLHDYRTQPEIIESLRNCLSKFVGTKCYHNYTSNKSPSEANAMRYISEFICSEPFIDTQYGVEWVSISILGQSFLLNQIRKMIGVAIDVTRGSASFDTIDGSFLPTKKVSIPMVPGVGLYLRELFFDRYNAKLDGDERNFLKKKEANSVVGVSVVEKVAEADILPVIAIVDGPTVIGLDSANTEAPEEDDTTYSHAERLLWSEDQEIVAKTKAFRNGIIWPHIFAQEESGLHFLYYLDHLRVAQYSYELQPYRSHT